MTKKVVLLVLILLGGSTWFGLDYLDKQQKAEAEELHVAVASAHARAVAEAKAKEKAGAGERFEAEIHGELNNCMAAAEKSSNDYVALHQKPAHRKNSQPTVSKAFMDEAAKMLGSSNAECQKNYDTRLKGGA